MKLSQFPTTGRRSTDLYNVTDFFNTMDIREIKLIEAGGKWNEESKLQMLTDAWDGCKLHMEHYTQHVSIFHTLGKEVTCESIRTALTFHYNTILQAMASQDMLSESRQSNAKDQNSATPATTSSTEANTKTVIGKYKKSTCKDCGHRCHSHKGFKGCPMRGSSAD